ncbi:MAG: ABC transporter permease [Bacteroidota bacterium]
MLKNQLLLAYRVLRKNFFYSLINILGLAVGMAAVFVIGSYVQFERSYDQETPSRAYRVLENDLTNGEQNAGLVPIYGPALQENMPGVQATLRLFSQGGTVQVADDSQPQAFSENYYIYADSSFFSFFPWPMRAGRHPMPDPYSVALSTGQAKKYFGDEDALGQSLVLRDMFGVTEYTVTAVYELPENTQLPISMVFTNTRLFHEDNAGNYIQGWGAFTTYIAIADDVTPQAIEEASIGLINTYQGEDAQLSLSLQPISDVYLSGDPAVMQHGTYGNPGLIKLLGWIGVVILALAWINYVNLATARAMERAREVGVRKTLGSGRGQLVFQFLMEAGVLNSVAALIAITLVQMFAPFLESYASVEFLPSLTYQPGTYLLWFGMLIGLGTVASGAYPAFILSGFRPVQVLKGLWRGGKQGLSLRRLLVVLQFTTSVVLLGGTFTIFQQVQYMRNRPLGIDINRNIVLKAPRVLDSLAQQRKVTFYEQLSQNPYVESVTQAGGMPGIGFNYGNALFSFEDAEREFPVEVSVTEVDHGFFEHFSLPVLAGERFLLKPDRDYSRIIINATACEGLGYSNPEDAVGQKIWANFYGDAVEIIGVVADYHHESMHNAIQGIVFHYSPDAGRYGIKVKTDSYTLAEMETVLGSIRSQFDESFPGNPFDYSFLDDRFASLYAEDQRLGSITALFSGLAVLIGCLGLLGLAAYMALQRTKEVGIRKVLGASGGQIFLLLSHEFLRLVGLAVLLAMPLLYAFNRLWLAEFPFRSPFSILPYLLPAFLVGLFAWSTVSYQTWQAARANPSKALRSE